MFVSRANEITAAGSPQSRALGIESLRVREPKVIIVIARDDVLTAAIGRVLRKQRVDAELLAPVISPAEWKGHMLKNLDATEAERALRSLERISDGLRRTRAVELIVEKDLDLVEGNRSEGETIVMNLMNGKFGPLNRYTPVLSVGSRLHQDVWNINREGLLREETKDLRVLIGSLDEYFSH